MKEKENPKNQQANKAKSTTPAQAKDHQKNFKRDEASSQNKNSQPKK